MEFKIVNNSVQVIHDKVILSFSWREFYQRCKDTVGTFGPINEYIASLPKQTVDNIFRAYRDIYDVYGHYATGDEDVNGCIEHLADRIHTFYELIDMRNFKKWCSYNGNFRIHSDLRDDLGRYKEETTYLKSDYAGLLLFAVLIKPMAPIWGEFITRFKGVVGNDRKESMALTLINRTFIPELEEYKKLIRYVEVSTSKTEGTATSIMGGLGTADLAECTLGALVIRKVALYDVSGGGSSLISIIHGYIRFNVTDKDVLNKRGSNRVFVRTMPGDSSTGNEEDNDSLADKYKFRQSKADHVSMVTSAYLGHIEPIDNSRATLSDVQQKKADAIKKLLLRCDSDFPIDNTKYKDLYNGVILDSLSDHDTHQIRYQLIAIVTALNTKALSTSTIVPMEHRDTIIVTMVTQAILHHWGLDTLAHLMTAKGEMLDDDTVRDRSIQSVDVKSQAMLLEIYPYWSPAQKADLKRKRFAKQSVPVRFMEDFTNYTYRFGWHFNSPDYLYEDSNLNGTYFQPSHLRNELTDLIIRANNR